MADDRAVRRLLERPPHGPPSARPRAPGVPGSRALTGEPGRRGSRPGEVERLGALGGSDCSPPGVRTGRVGPHLGGRRVLRVLLDPRRRCMVDRPSPSLLSVRANRAGRGRARVAVSNPPAAPGELDPGNHPLDDPHRRLVRRPPRSEPGDSGAARRGLLWAGGRGRGRTLRRSPDLWPGLFLELDPGVQPRVRRRPTSDGTHEHRGM